MAVLKNLCDEIFGKNNFLGGAGQFPRNIGAASAVPDAGSILSYTRSIENCTSLALSTMGFDTAGSARPFLLPSLLEAAQLGKDDALLNITSNGINTVEALMRMDTLNAGSRQFTLVRPAQTRSLESASPGGTIEIVAELTRG